MPYRSLSSEQVAAVAVALLGGTARPVDVEDAAIKAYSLGPEWFCWTRHRDQIDLQAVRDALGRAEKQGLLRRVGNDWLATQVAADLAAETAKKVDKKPPSFSPPMTDSDRRSVHGKNRLVHTRAYSMYMTGRPDGITEIDFYEFAGMPPVATGSELAECVDLTDDLVKGDSQLESLWEEMRSRFLLEK